MTDQLKKVKACGICKIVTDDGVNTAPCHCPKNTDPLKELEEWAETQKLLSRLANSGPHRTSASVYNECYQEFCNHVLAKIAEMRKVDT